MVETCRFINHASGGLVANESALVAVSGKSEFIGNGIAVASTDNSRIEISGALLRYRPSAGNLGLEEMGGGTIRQSDMTIEETP